MVQLSEWYNFEPTKWLLVFLPKRQIPINPNWTIRELCKMAEKEGLDLQVQIGE